MAASELYKTKRKKKSKRTARGVSVISETVRDDSGAIDSTK